MSTTLYNRPLGLGYLNEQQRFKHAGIKAAPQSMDIIAGVHPTAARVARMHNDVMLAPVSIARQQLHQATVQPAAIGAVPANIFEKQLTAGPLVQHSRLRHHIPVVIASIAIVLGLGILASTLRQNHKAAAQVAGIAAKAAMSTDEGTGAVDHTPPSEAPLEQNAIASYVVAPSLPRLISINKISVNARILPMGVLPSGALATPKNTNDTGWYDASSKPGENGTALIIGHVSGATKAGIFYNLKKLVTNDEIVISKGDGTIVRYKVVKSEVIAAQDVDMSKLLVSVIPGKPGLNLMTCAGTYDAQHDEFNNRQIIYAVQF